jgi:hypothetical protein
MIEAKQFGDAMSLIKIGHRVTRFGWNGQGMWLVLISPGNAMHRSVAGSYDMAPCIGMKTAQNTMQPGWVPSQADMLASDWIDLDESEEPVVAEIANLRESIERSEAAHRAELSRVQGLLDDVAHAHERDILAIWKALGETHEPPENVGAILGLTLAQRAHLIAVARATQRRAALLPLADRPAVLAEVVRRLLDDAPGSCVALDVCVREAVTRRYAPTPAQIATAAAIVEAVTL